MFDGLNEKESMEVLDVHLLTLKWNHKQIYSLLNKLAWDLRHMIDEIEERDKFRVEIPESWKIKDVEES